jgi:hypothetical protein
VTILVARFWVFLDEKDHQESNDRRASVDEKLPRVGVVEVGPRHRPHDDGEEGNQKRQIRANRLRCFLCKSTEYLFHGGPPRRCRCCLSTLAVAGFCVPRRLSNAQSGSACLNLECVIHQPASWPDIGATVNELPSVRSLNQTSSSNIKFLESGAASGLFPISI